MPLSDGEVQAILKAEKSSALGGFQSSDLVNQRTKAMDYFLGDMSEDLPAPPDRSQAVSTDVADTVEGLMPSLMEIFMGGDQVVEFSPQGIEDEPLAEQETDYVNHLLLQKNPGFLILYNFIKDALISKNGVVKVFWEEKEEEDEQTIWGLDEVSYGLLRQMEDAGKLKIVEHTERLGLPGQQPQDEAYG